MLSAVEWWTKSDLSLQSGMYVFQTLTAVLPSPFSRLCKEALYFGPDLPFVRSSA